MEISTSPLVTRAAPRGWSVLFSSRAAVVAAGAVLALLLWRQTGTVRQTSSITYDEFTYAEMAFRIHQQSGHDAFLVGRSDSSGWWYYFVIAFALKSTPVEVPG